MGRSQGRHQAARHGICDIGGGCLECQDGVAPTSHRGRRHSLCDSHYSTALHDYVSQPPSPPFPLSLDLSSQAYKLIPPETALSSSFHHFLSYLRSHAVSTSAHLRPPEPQPRLTLDDPIPHTMTLPSILPTWKLSDLLHLRPTRLPDAHPVQPSPATCTFGCVSGPLPYLQLFSCIFLFLSFSFLACRRNMQCSHAALAEICAVYWCALEARPGHVAIPWFCYTEPGTLAAGSEASIESWGARHGRRFHYCRQLGRSARANRRLGCDSMR